MYCHTVLPQCTITAPQCTVTIACNCALASHLYRCIDSSDLGALALQEAAAESVLPAEFLVIESTRDGLYVTAPTPLDDAMRSRKVILLGLVDSTGELFAAAAAAQRICVLVLVVAVPRQPPGFRTALAPCMLTGIGTDWCCRGSQCGVACLAGWMCADAMHAGAHQ